jgi:hypothetical protein
MTDPHDLDELASAHVDGTTTPEEAALLAGDPDLQARVEQRAEELRAVRDAVAEVVPVDPVHRDASIAAALAAFDEDDAPHGDRATVTPLAPRRGLSPRAVRALGAAAVVLLLALLVPLLAHRQDTDDEASFQATGDALPTTVANTDGDTALDKEAASPEAQQDRGTGASGSVADAFIGSYDDLDALAAAIAAERASPTAAPRSVAAASDDAAMCMPLTSSTSTAWVAVVDGVVVEVHVDTTEDGTRTMTVLRRDGCDQLDQREL